MPIEAGLGIKRGVQVAEVDVPARLEVQRHIAVLLDPHKG